MVVDQLRRHHNHDLNDLESSGRGSARNRRQESFSSLRRARVRLGDAYRQRRKKDRFPSRNLLRNASKLLNLSRAPGRLPSAERTEVHPNFTVSFYELTFGLNLRTTGKKKEVRYAVQVIARSPEPCASKISGPGPSKGCSRRISRSARPTRRVPPDIHRAKTRSCDLSPQRCSIRDRARIRLRELVKAKATCRVHRFAH